MCVLRSKNRCAVLRFGNHFRFRGMSSLLFLRNRPAAVGRSRLCVLVVAGHSDCRLSLSVDSRSLPALIVFRCRVSPNDVLPVTDWPAAFISFFVIFSLLFFTSLALPDGIGGGDVKLLSILSLAFGLEPTLFIILLASFSAGSYFLHTHMTNGSSLQRRLPFGPFLAASAVVVHFAQMVLVR